MKAEKKKKKKVVKEKIPEPEPEPIKEPEPKVENKYFDVDGNIHVVFLVYAPGTNKDDSLYPTLSKRGFQKISIGELLKEEGVNHEVYGKQIQECFDQRKDVPGEVVVRIIESKIDGYKEKFTRFLICGFPRSESNSQAWKKIIRKKYVVHALVYITYTRKEYEYEIKLRTQNSGKKFDYQDLIKRFNYFITSTKLVFDDFGEEKLIRISAKLEDNLICDHIMRHKLICDAFPYLK